VLEGGGRLFDTSPMGEEVLSDRKNSVTSMVLSSIHARGLHGRIPVLIAEGHIMQGPMCSDTADISAPCDLRGSLRPLSSLTIMASVQTTETQLGATMMTVMECRVLGTRWWVASLV